jgi:hypothetical protein
MQEEIMLHTTVLMNSELMSVRKLWIFYWYTTLRRRRKDGGWGGSSLEIFPVRSLDFSIDLVIT